MNKTLFQGTRKLNNTPQHILLFSIFKLMRTRNKHKSVIKNMKIYSLKLKFEFEKNVL